MTEKQPCQGPCLNTGTADSRKSSSARQSPCRQGSWVWTYVPGSGARRLESHLGNTLATSPEETTLKQPQPQCPGPSLGPRTGRLSFFPSGKSPLGE